VQLGCHVTSCDVSPPALSIGRELFERYPPISDEPTEHRYEIFNGETIQATDAFYDCIVVNDAFHHLPNQRQILLEMFRVLREDGVVGMSEPGRTHSTTADSQREMQEYGVIENDIVLEDLWQMANDAGFKDIRIGAVLRQSYMDIDEYMQCIAGEVPGHVTRRLSQDTHNHSLFFLHKSPLSRGVEPHEKPAQLSCEEFDEGFYLATYPDVARAVANGLFASGWEHYKVHGGAEGRRGRAV